MFLLFFVLFFCFVFSLFTTTIVTFAATAAAAIYGIIIAIVFRRRRTPMVSSSAAVFRFALPTLQLFIMPIVLLSSTFAALTSFHCIIFVVTATTVAALIVTRRMAALPSVTAGALVLQRLRRNTGVPRVITTAAAFLALAMRRIAGTNLVRARHGHSSDGTAGVVGLFVAV